MQCRSAGPEFTHCEEYEMEWTREKVMAAVEAHLEWMQTEDEPDSDDRVGDVLKVALAGADLHGLDLHDENFSGMDLTTTNLSNAYLVGAIFRDSDLTGADFTEAVIADVQFGCKIAGANFSKCKAGPAADYGEIARAWAHYDLHGVTGAGVDFSGMDLRHAIMRGGSFRWADFTDATMHYADLENADLTGASCSGAEFDYADLAHADMSDADCCGAQFDDANLQGADLQSAVLNDATWQGATYDKHTLFPDDFDPIAAGLVLVETT